MATAKKKIKITCFNFTWVSNPKRSQNDSWNFSQASRRPENDTKKSRALKWYVTHNKLISTHVDHCQHLHFAEFSNGFLNTYNPETLLICFTPLSEWLKKLSQSSQILRCKNLTQIQNLSFSSFPALQQVRLFSLRDIVSSLYWFYLF